MLPRSLNRYRTVDNVTSVLGRSPIELILLVYDRIADNLSRASAAIDERRDDTLADSVNQAVDLISQGLIASLDFERGGDIAQNLSSIYEYCLRRLLAARLHKDPSAIQEIAVLLADLRQAWINMAEPAQLQPT